MEFQLIVNKAREITSMYDQLNQSQGYPKWELQQHVQGLMEDMGSLARLTLMKEGRRFPAVDLNDKLRHEICDCLWSVIRIADALEIDLETEFPKQMDLLAERIKKEQH